MTRSIPNCNLGAHSWNDTTPERTCTSCKRSYAEMMTAWLAQPLPKRVSDYIQKHGGVQVVAVSFERMAA
jgi:hypothetical protein